MKSLSRLAIFLPLCLMVTACSVTPDSSQILNPTTPDQTKAALKAKSDQSKKTSTEKYLSPSQTGHSVYWQIAAQVGTDTVTEATFAVARTSDKKRAYVLEVKTATGATSEKFNGELLVVLDSDQFADITLDNLATGEFVSRETSSPVPNCIDLHFNSDELTKRNSKLQLSELILCKDETTSTLVPTKVPQVDPATTL